MGIRQKTRGIKKMLKISPDGWEPTAKIILNKIPMDKTIPYDNLVKLISKELFNASTLGHSMGYSEAIEKTKSTAYGRKEELEAMIVGFMSSMRPLLDEWSKLNK